MLRRKAKSVAIDLWIVSAIRRGPAWKEKSEAAQAFACQRIGSLAGKTFDVQNTSSVKRAWAMQAALSWEENIHRLRIEHGRRVATIHVTFQTGRHFDGLTCFASPLSSEVRLVLTMPEEYVPELFRC